MPTTKNSNNKNQDMPQYNSEYENVYLGFVTLSMNLITKQQQQKTKNNKIILENVIEVKSMFK